MSISKKNCIAMLAAFLLALIALIVIGTESASAAVSFRGYGGYTISFDTYNNASSELLETEATSEDITSAVSSDNSVAYANIRYGTHLDIYPKGPGSCTITVYGESGGVCYVPVEVTTDYFKNRLRYGTVIYDATYGSKKIKVYSEFGEGVKVTLKVGTKKYKTKTTNYYGNATIKLSKVYPLNKKYSVTVSYGGAKRTFKGKFISATYLGGYFKVSKKSPKKVKVHCLNLHKGDVIKVKYKGKVYSSSKIKKTYSSRYVTVKVGKKFTKSSRFRVWIINKDKKRLTNDYIVQLHNWVCDETDDPGDDDWDDDWDD